MALSYEKKRRTQKWLVIAAIIIAVIALLLAGRFVYLQRFLVYDADGVHLDYGRQPVYPQRGESGGSSGDFPLEQKDPTGLSGAYGQVTKPYKGALVSVGQLADTEVRNRIADNVGTANSLMLEMKTDTGKFLYNTALSHTEKGNADCGAIESLVKTLSQRTDLWLIAKIPAFRDSAFAVADYAHSLALKNGALWMDEHGSYRLDPAGSDVEDYLVSTARELYALGFDEIVFEDFNFPASQNVVYNREISGNDATLALAKSLKERLSLYNIPVSFMSEQQEIATLSQRVYIVPESGASVSAEAQKYGEFLQQDDGKLVFITASKDTRFYDYSVLAPLEIAE